MPSSYIIYANTIFVREVKGGWELAEDYTGEVNFANGGLPDFKVIKRALKETGFHKKQHKKIRRARVALVPREDGTIEALPQWGVFAGQLYGRELTADAMYPILTAPNVVAIVFTDEDDNVTYIEADEVTQPEEEPAREMPSMQKTLSTGAGIHVNLP